MKKLKYIYTALLLLCCIVANAHDFEVDGIYYNITNATNKTVRVTYRGNYYYSYDNEYTGSVVIPESVYYNGTTYSVTSIGECTFEYCSGLTSITIPNSVTSIGDAAFSGCSGLTSIVIPNSVTSIGRDTFSYCSSLTSIVIPNSVTSIEYYTFGGCTGLTSITIPNSVTSIGWSAFHSCSNLTSIEIPNSVTSIEPYAFDGCSGLTSIEIPNSVTSIGERTFESCSGLTSIVIPNSVTSIGYYAFSGCSGLTSITIPNSVTSIGDAAFSGCSGLTSIVIPNSVTRIGWDTFKNCSGLTSITIPNSVTWIDPRAFYGCSGLTSITIPNSVTSIGEYAFSGCSGLTSIIIPNSVTSIENYAFLGCNNLKTVINFSDLEIVKGKDNHGYIAYYANKLINVTTGSVEGDFVFGELDGLNTLISYLGNDSVLSLPANYKGENYVIGAETFKNNVSITSITIPNCVTSIGNYAFYGCSGLTSITIPNSVTSIGGSAFSGCSGLTSITIPNSVTSIGNYAFSGCSGLTSIEIPSSVTSIGNYAFENCTSLKDLRIENGDETLALGYNYAGYNSGQGLFNDCPLETLYLGRNLSYNTGSYYGYSPFYNISTLKSVTISNNVTSIGNNAFANCFGLNSVYISDITAWCRIDFGNNAANPLNIAHNLYLNGELITELRIPYEINEIKPYTFSGFSLIKSVEIHNGITSVGIYAFSGCENIETLYISNSIESIGEYAFAGCEKIKEIKIGLEKPIKGNANIFAAAVYDNATLYIPNGTKSLYDKREPWNLFFDITEIDFTGIDDVKAECGEVKTVYDLQGRMVDNPTDGIYIINGKKVLVK